MTGVGRGGLNGRTHKKKLPPKSPALLVLRVFMSERTAFIAEDVQTLFLQYICSTIPIFSYCYYCYLNRKISDHPFAKTKQISPSECPRKTFTYTRFINVQNLASKWDQQFISIWINYIAWKVFKYKVFLVRMRENADQKKLCIWTFFTQCHYHLKVMILHQSNRF